MHPAGNFKAKAVDWGLATTKSGAEQLFIEFATEAGENITYYGSFSDGAFDFTIEALRNCGWQGDDLLEIVEGAGGRAQLDNDVSLKIDHETYDGKLRAKVKFVNRAGGSGVSNRLDAQGAASFAQRMKGRIAASERARGVAGGSAPRPAARPPARAAARPPEPSPADYGFPDAPDDF